MWSGYKIGSYRRTDRWAGRWADRQTGGRQIDSRVDRQAGKQADRERQTYMCMQRSNLLFRTNCKSIGLHNYMYMWGPLSVRNQFQRWQRSLGTTLATTYRVLTDSFITQFSRRQHYNLMLWKNRQFCYIIHNIYIILMLMHMVICICDRKNTIFADDNVAFKTQTHWRRKNKFMAITPRLFYIEHLNQSTS